MTSTSTESSTQTSFSTRLAGRLPRVKDWQPPSWFYWLLFVFPVVVILYWVSPANIFSTEFPQSGDLMAHRWWTKAFFDQLLSGHVVGYTKDVATGWGLGYFYFPTPAAIVGVLSLVVGYAIALKLILIASTFMFLFACRRLLSALSAPPLTVALAPLAAFVAVMPFADFQRVMGGTVISTWTGEFSYMLGLGFGLWFLAVLIEAFQQKNSYALAGVLFALTLTSHVNVALVIALVSFVLWVDQTRKWKTFVKLLSVASLSVGLSAAWFFPMLTQVSNTPGNAFPAVSDLRFLFPPRWWPVWALALLGVVVGFVLRRRHVRSLLLIALPVLVVFFIPINTFLWNGRALPIYYTVLALLAASALSDLASLASLKIPVAVPSTLSVLALAVVPFLYTDAVPVLKTTTQGASAYADYKQYNDVINAAKALPPGRVFYERWKDGAEYGANIPFLVLPAVTDGRLTVARTLFYESSYSQLATATTMSLVSPFSSRFPVGLVYGTTKDFDQGVDQMQQLGVRYFFATSQEMVDRANGNNRLRLVASTGEVSEKPGFGWNIYEIKDWSLVEPLSQTPVVTSGQEFYGTTDWFTQMARFWPDFSDRQDSPLIAQSGPENWTTTTIEQYPSIQVSNIKVENEKVSFDVDQTGVPVVVKLAYFDRFKATGAQGPWRIAPDFMVVIPTDNHVVLQFEHAWIEYLSMVVSGASLLVAGFWFYRERQHLKMTGVRLWNRSISPSEVTAASGAGMHAVRAPMSSSPQNSDSRNKKDRLDANTDLSTVKLSITPTEGSKESQGEL